MSLYTESMSLACQFGRCEECPVDGVLYEGEPADGCTCVCHIPGDDQADPDDDDINRADEAVRAFWRRVLPDMGAST